MLESLLCIGALCYMLFYLIVLCFVDCDLQLAYNEKFGKSIGHLKGKVVFITGASSGIGKHTAIAFAKHGVKLVLTARRYGLLEEVKTLCLDASQGTLSARDVLILQMDMLDMASHKKHFETALAHFGRIDILFSNAGRSQRAIWDSIDIKVDKEMFDLNVHSVINLTRIAVQHFNTIGHGHVAVTSSVGGFVGIPYSASYTGAKHAIHGYFNSLRTEKLGTELDLTVTIICPGPTHTEFLRESFTGTTGEKYGVSVNETDRRMTGERCGQLCAVALANKSRESWLCIFPVLHLCYCFVHFPSISNFILAAIGTKRLFSIRDSKNPTDLLERKST